MKADLLEDQGREPAALAVRRKAHADRPWDRGARLALARGLALASSDLALALELAQACAAEAPTPEALEVLALVRAARGEFSAALTSAEDGLARAAPPARALLSFRRAEALAGLGRADEASRALAEALRLAGADPRAKPAAARVERLLSPPRG